MPKKAQKTLWLVLILVVALLSGCTGGKMEPGEVNEKVIVVGLPAEPVTLDPHQMQDYNSIQAGRSIFNTLVEYKEGSTEVEPGLAISWDIGEEGLEYVFQLRSGVLFQDGTPFNAAAVQFSLERQINPDHPYHDTGIYPYAQYALGLIEKVEVMDEHTVKITLREPFAPFLTHLAMPAACIVSPEAVKKHGSKFAQNPVGTGPYQLASWQPGEELVLEKNPHCWSKKASIDKFIFKTVVSSKDRINALEEGYLDLILNISPSDLGALENNKHIAVWEQPGISVEYIAFNCQRAPFKDVRVRQAFNYAINKKAIVQDVLQGAGQLAAGPLPPGIWSRNTAVEQYPYDPEKAVQLMVEAGYPQGMTVTFLVPKAGPRMQMTQEIAKAIQQDLAQVGVVVKIQTADWDAHLHRVFVPAHLSDVQMHQMSWAGDSGDPDNYLFPLFSSEQWPVAGFNSAYYKNQQVDQLLKQARTIPHQQGRVSLYREAQKIIMEESPWMVLFHEKQIMAMHKKIKGFKPHPTGLLRLELADLE